MCPLVYLSHGLVRVCEIELSHMGKHSGIPDLVQELMLSLRKGHGHNG